MPEVVTSVSPKLNSGFNVIENPNSSYRFGIGVGVAVGGIGVAVGGIGVAVGGIGVAIGGIGVAVEGTDVAVGGTDVAVGGTDVAVGGAGTAVAWSVVLATGGEISVVSPPPHAKRNTNGNKIVELINNFGTKLLFMNHH